MGDNVYLNADKTAVVPEWAAGKKWQVRRSEAARLGLLDSDTKPVQTRRVPAETHAETPADKPKPQRRRSKRK